MRTFLILTLLLAGAALRASDLPDAAVPYPLQTCIVSGDKLGEMGKPVMIDYKGRQIGFCCKSCIGDFEKDPAKYLAKLPAK